MIRLLLDFGEVFGLTTIAIHRIYDSSTTSASADGIMYKPSTLRPSCFDLTLTPQVGQLSASTTVPDSALPNLSRSLTRRFSYFFSHDTVHP